jgi:hypothetical protein
VGELTTCEVGIHDPQVCVGLMLPWEEARLLTGWKSGRFRDAFVEQGTAEIGREPRDG